MEPQTNIPSTHPSTESITEHAFDFRGHSGEFFRLEIKNLFLSVLTLGIYSAWATVARKKYLANHTFIDGNNFEYTADPKIILRSRIIIVLVLAASMATSAIDEMVSVFTTLGLVLCIPWAVASSMAFHAKNTTHRGARFSFHASMGESYRWYFGLVAIQLFTLGLGFPLLHRRLSRYVINHRKLGGVPFECKAERGPFARLTFQYIGLLALTCAVCMGVMAGATFLLIGTPDPDALAQSGMSSVLAVGVNFAMGFAIYAVLLFVAAFVLSRSVNLVYNSTQFGAHRFESNQDWKSLGWLAFTNLVGVVLSLGLAYPWARLRMHRYRFDHLKVKARGPLMAGVTLDPHPGGRGGSDAHGAALLDIAGGIDFGL